MKRLSLIFLLVAVCAHGGMVRVVSVDDARSITIERPASAVRFGIGSVSAPYVFR